MWKTLLLPLTLLLLTQGCGTSENPASDDTETPPFPPLPEAPEGFERLTVVVAVVDSLMPGDINTQSMPTLGALIDAGTFYTQSRSVFAAETIPNHVAMMTGVYPDRNGIPTNNFWDKDENPDNPTDEDLSLPKEMTAKTLFTWIREECPDLTTSALMSKDYLFEIFCGDDPKEDDDLTCIDRSFVNDNPNLHNVQPDLFWNPQEDPSFIPSPGGLTPDNTTMQQALERLPGADFMFINLGNVDRSAHAAGEQFRTAALVAVDVELGNLVTALQNAGRWQNTVLIVVSDHGMDYSTAGPVDSITLQGALDTLSNSCGFEPMITVQGGGTDHVFITNLEATPERRQATLRAARSCLLDSDSPECVAIETTDCPLGTNIAPTVNAFPPPAQPILDAWYRVNDPLDPAGDMPANIESDHENIGDLIFIANDGFKFAEPNGSGNPIPGNHGHLVTLQNSMLVSGGVDFLNAGASIEPPAAEANPGLLDRVSNQSENIDITPTVAWLFGLDIRNDEFPDHPLGEINGFDGRILNEAFIQFNGNPNANSPSSCGLIPVNP